MEKEQLTPPDMQDLLTPPHEAVHVVLSPKDVKVGERHTGIRRIFDGDVPYDEWERQQINDLKILAKKHKTDLSLPFWTDANILRFLQGNNFLPEKTIKSMDLHMEWRITRLPPKYNREIEDYLNSGVLYLQGRDNSFRPIVTFCPQKIDFATFNPDLLIDCITYLFDAMLKYSLLPGKIENWIFLMDLKDMGLSSLPIGPLKNLLTFLNNTFRSRLHTMYIVNTPFSIFIPWNIAKQLLSENTTRKIFFCNNHVPDGLLTHTSRDQLEQKFGGTYPTRTNYWPPVLPKINLLDANIKEEVKQAIKDGTWAPKALRITKTDSGLIMETPPESGKTRERTEELEMMKPIAIPSLSSFRSCLDFDMVPQTRIEAVYIEAKVLGPDNSFIEDEEEDKRV